MRVNEIFLDIISFDIVYFVFNRYYTLDVINTLMLPGYAQLKKKRSILFGTIRDFELREWRVSGNNVFQHPL